MPTASQRTKPLGLFQGKLTPRLYDHLIGVLPVRHYSRRTEGNRQWRWQFVFPQERRWVSARSGEQGRHHVHESLVQKALSQAVRKARLTKRVTGPMSARQKLPITPRRA